MTELRVRGALPVAFFIMLCCKERNDMVSSKKEKEREHHRALPTFFFPLFLKVTKVSSGFVVSSGFRTSKAPSKCSGLII
jgi:hypothetical protein